MGILNVTPDSFYDGGQYKSDGDILNHVETILNEGATFLDIGAYSSRPNANHVSEDEELKRILPIVQLILKEFPKALVSIDTFRSKVAKLCVDNGAALVNDISGGNMDKNMIKTIANLKVPYIMMHIKGTPQTMQQETKYSNLVKDILFYFSERITSARELGIIDLIVDPGFGFAKTIEQNFNLLNNLDLFKILELPIMVGLSRKSLIYKTLKNTQDDALNGTTVLNTIALQKGASILRVHDVKEAMQCIALTNRLY